MANEQDKNKSKFLKFQDKNNDGLSDVCVSLPMVPEGKCPPCIPNPNFINPKWRTQDPGDPWFNGKSCTYQVAIQTSHQTLLGTNNEDLVGAIFEQYREEAVEKLLIGFNKEDTEDAREALRPEMKNQKYNLEPRPNSYLKLLYSVPYETLAVLPPADDSEEEEDTSESEGEDIVVEYEANSLYGLNIRWCKAMNLYKRFYRVYSWAEGGQLVFQDTGKLFTVTAFDRYGSMGLFGSSTMSRVLTDLDSFLNARELNIVGGGGWAFFQEAVQKLEFTFSSKYKLKQLKVWTAGCGGKPFVYGPTKLASLTNKASWKDPTAVAYFAQLKQIDNRLNARQEIPWLEIVKEFTYPVVVETPAIKHSEIARETQDLSSCVGEALEGELKSLGQDIVDSIFSIGDAVAYQFHKNVCSKNASDRQDTAIKLGTVLDPMTGEDRPIGAMALDQAFKQLEADDAVFVGICARIIQAAGGGFMGFSSQSLLDGIYSEGLDRIKLCGLFDMLMDALMCLMGGLSLEEAVSKLIGSALRAMDSDNLEDFFVGLPPEKQAELAALVEKKIKEGDVFKDASGAAAAGGPQVVSDTISGKLKWSKPWESKKKANPDKHDFNNLHGKTDSELTRRTLAQTMDPGEWAQSAKNELSPDIVLEAYIMALIEVYSDDLLSVIDMLNRYPGAQLIAKVIALADCPRPPMFDPNFLDFLRSIDLPWCRSQTELALPKLVNLFGWIPKLKDITYWLWQALILLLQRIIIMIIMKILILICQLLGDAICKALELTGALAAAAVTGGSFSDAIRKTICGDDAPQEQVDNTIAEMFAKFGVGGAALADKETVLNFAEDIASSCTRMELVQAFQGEMPAGMKEVVINLVKYSYPQLQEAFPNKDSISDFMKNVGNLMPQAAKQALNDFGGALPEDDFMPANPSLCASPEQLEDFKELRCAILEGRATPEQCNTMFNDLQDEMGEDLETLANFANNPWKDLGPLVSQPGCDDGLIPFESNEQAEMVGNVGLGGEMKTLQRAYTEDMLGNGFWESDWGLINMIMADTMGKPLTTHWRKAAFWPDEVDFITDGEVPDESTFFLFFSDPSPTVQQRGNFPWKVAPWLQSELDLLTLSFDSNNDWKTYNTKWKSYEDLGMEEWGLFSGTEVDIDMTRLPDFGYNIKYRTNVNNGIAITRAGRKGTPDIAMVFHDNNKGDDKWSHGYKVSTFLADMEASSVNGRTQVHNIGSLTEPIDATRINISELENAGVFFSTTLKRSMTSDEWDEYVTQAKARGGRSEIKSRLFEFIAHEETLVGVNPVEYPEFVTCFEEQQSYSPPVILLGEMMKNRNPGATIPSKGGIKARRDDFMSEIYKGIRDEISGNENAFMYGASYDTLTPEATEYVVGEDQTESPGGTPYGEAEIKDEDGSLRSIENGDMILGVSKDYWDNGKDNARVFYLDPMTYGGSYTNPAVYIGRPKETGWMAFIDVLYPDMSPCKPRNTDLVDFKSIREEISRQYRTIPEDERLKANPDCVEEVPYNRILMRPGKAAIQGYIRAACRIYGSTHMIKAMASYTMFKPDFDNVFGNIVPSYIVEVMEKSLKDAQGGFWEWFNSFKDNEFWYAFLEQSVQTYGRLVDSGEIVDPPQTVLDALFRLNEAQENYNYPWSSKAVEKANKVNETTAPYSWPFKSSGLEDYREEKKFDAIHATEEDAKIVLKEWVKKELNYMGEKFMQNLGSINLAPKYTDMDYYMFTKHCQGTTDLDLDKELKIEYVDLPIIGANHYTAGAEFSKPTGEDYVGYYHVHLDIDNNIVYMEGEVHTEEEHGVLTPYANKMQVKIGDVAPLNSVAIQYEDAARPFVLEKYISINGTKYEPSYAIAVVKSAGTSPDQNISDIYPGTIEQVVDENGRIVGITGELAVKYGLQLSYVTAGQKFLLTETEVGALDTKLSQIAPLDGNSMLLYCLFNQLKDTPEFKLVSGYIFPVRKALSGLAIYNDLGFIDSIGEKTVSDGDTKPKWLSMSGPTFASKPGAKVTFPNSPDSWNADYSFSNDKWASYGDRSSPWSPFYLTFDEWDRVLLRNSKSRLKKLFKNHYYSRKFNPADPGDTDYMSVLTANLKASLKPTPGKAILPWFKKGLLRGNVFNANGEICKKKD